MEKVINWNGMELVIKQFEQSHANGGRLGKLWVEDLKSKRVFLIKSSSPFGYEPFSEKIAYIIGKNLGIDVLEYDILPSKIFKGVITTSPFCKYVSICEKIDRKDCSITSVSEIKRARNAVLSDDETKLKNREVMYNILTKKYIDTMLLFDAIIGNEDRHYGNVHVLRNTDGEIVAAPILDNGASLLALRTIMKTFLLGYNVGYKINLSYTISRNHDEQVESISSFDSINFNISKKILDILRDIEPTLELMPKFRAKIVKRYIVYRLHKYLGMIKHSDIIEYMNENKKKI